MLTSDQVKCFIAAAECGNFSKAADHIFMSQPTFSRNISAMEQEVGFALFARGARTSTLTDAGRVLYDGMKKITEEYQSLLDEARQVHAGLKGQLYLGILEGQLIDEKISEIIRMFREMHPGIRVHLARYGFHEMLDALRSGELDIGFTLTEDIRRQREFAFREIYMLRNELIVTRDHPLAGVKGLTLADFADDVFIDIAPEESAGVSELLVNSCRAAGFEPEMKYVPDLRTQVFCVETGEGISAFNEYHQVYNHPGLTHIPLSEFPPVGFCAARLRDGAKQAAVLFMEMLPDSSDPEPYDFSI